MKTSPYRLVAFDVDGTIVKSHTGEVVWQLLNRRYGVPEELAQERFESVLAGNLSYAEWVSLDIQSWIAAGARRPEIARVIRDNLFLVPGTLEALGELRTAGCALAVISGTLDITLDLLLPEHPFSHVYTNCISFDAEGRICGWQATEYDMEGKTRALHAVAARCGVSLAQTVFVGDNINDVHAMREAGLAVAFEPKHDAVVKAAGKVVRGDLRDVANAVLTPRRSGVSP
ncbi:MAG: HAD family phosphatase [Candidatus Schekmanbacteria bacterium]|nr:HAD family phosphatase [Candidatus Schekmanbacteria bacterium]